MSVFENIAFPCAPQRAGPEQREAVRSMLDLVRLPGIEIALLGAALRRPGAARGAGAGADRAAAVLLLDEPLAALDLKLRKAMQLELRRIQEELGT